MNGKMSKFHWLFSFFFFSSFYFLWSFNYRWVFVAKTFFKKGVKLCRERKKKKSCVKRSWCDRNAGWKEWSIKRKTRFHYIPNDRIWVYQISVNNMFKHFMITLSVSLYFFILFSSHHECNVLWFAQTTMHSKWTHMHPAISSINFFFSSFFPFHLSSSSLKSAIKCSFSSKI